MPILPQSIESQHYMVLHAPKFGATPDDLNFEVKFSGVALLNFKGNSDGSWHQDTLQISSKLLGMDKILEQVKPILPPLSTLFSEKYHFVPIQWVVYAGINATFNANNSVNAGYAVNTFGLMSTVTGNVRLMQGIQAQVAVRDKDGELLRVGYTATIYGYFVKRRETLVIGGG